MKNLWSKFKVWLIYKLGGCVPDYTCSASYEFPTISGATEYDIKSALSKIVDKLYKEECFTILSSCNYIGDYHVVKIELKVVKDKR